MGIGGKYKRDGANPFFDKGQFDSWLSNQAKGKSGGFGPSLVSSKPLSSGMAGSPSHAQTLGGGMADAKLREKLGGRA